MDSQTLELIRLLQAGPHDNAAFRRVRQLLPEARTRLAAEGDRETLVVMTELLQEWSRSAADPAAASLALYESGMLTEQMLGDPERAARIYALSVAANPRNLEAMQRAQTLLASLGQFVEIETVLSEQARSLAAAPWVEPEIRAAVFRALGSVRAEYTGNVDGAIEAFENALEAEPDVAVIEALARLYVGRNRDDDARQAADLYCTLGEVSEGAENVAYIEQALNLAPDHEQALDDLEALVPEAERPARLGGRWMAFIASAPDGPGVDARRRALAQAFMQEERYAEALQVISPLAAKGDAAAESIREGLYRLMGVDSGSLPAPGPARLAPDDWRSASVPPQAFDEKPTRDFRGASPAARPASFPPPGSVPATASYPAPEHPPVATALAAKKTATTPTPPVQRGGTLTGYAVSPEPRELYGAAMGVQPPAYEPPLAAPAAPAPAPATGRPQAPPPFPATEAPTLVLTDEQQPRMQVAPEAMEARAPQLQAAPAGAVMTPAAAFPAATRADTALLLMDEDIKPRSALPKLLIGTALLALAAGGVFAYMKHFKKSAEQAGSAAATASGEEAQVGTAGSGASQPATEQPGAAGKPAPAGAEPATTEEAKQAEAAETKGGEKAASDDVAESAEAEAKTEAKAKAEAKAEAEAEEEQRTVQMVTKLLRVRGGKINQDKVRKAAEKAFPTMERCYAKVRRRIPRLKGRVVLAWTIKTNGRVARARRVGGTIRNRDFAGCLAGALKKTRFPRPRRRPARVSLPFVFRQP